MKNTANVKQPSQLNAITVVLLNRGTNISPKVWGLSGAERLRRIFSNMNIEVIEESDLNTVPSNNTIILIMTDYAYDKPILSGLIDSTQTVLTDNNVPLAVHTIPKQAAAAIKWLQGKNDIPTGLEAKTTATIGGNFDSDLRKKEAPYCLKLDDETLKQTEHRIFMGTYKGVTDFVTKYFWPRPAMVVTKWCIKANISPNMVTIAGIILMFYALFLFWEGQYALGLLAGWIMTFLDTVDGKLARVTFTSSKIGNILDHGTDLIHPPFWYVAWAYGLVHVGMELPKETLNMLLIVIVGGYVAQRILEGYFIVRFHIHMHIWRKFDSFFRLITARRNPNMLLMTACVVINRPDWAVWAIAGWTFASLLVHLLQIIQAEFKVLTGGRVISWLER